MDALVVGTIAPAVTTGVFTLGGVLVGGLLNSLVSVRLERRSDRRAVRKALRLFGPQLTGVMWAIDRATQAKEWGKLPEAVGSSLAQWDEYAPVFAENLEWEEWQALLLTVMELQRLVETAPQGPAAITDEQASYLQGRFDRILDTTVALAGVSVAGTFGRQLHRVYRPSRTDPKSLGIPPVPSG